MSRLFFKRIYNLSIIEEECHEINIPEDFIFEIPADVSEIKINEKLVVINPNTGAYITLFNAKQISIYNNLKAGIDLATLTEQHARESADLSYVLATYFDSKLFTNNEKPNFEPVSNSLFIYLTDKCNLSCPHCYRNNSTLAKNELSLEQWMDLIDEFSSLGGKKITISGGEPLLHKDIDIIIKRIKDRGMSVTVLSNGTFWDKRFNSEEGINVIKSIDEIQLSLDGFDEDSNGIMRGIGNFERTTRNLNWLHSLGANISVAVTPSYDTVFSGEKYEKLLAFLNKLKHIATIRITQKILPNNSIDTFSMESDRYYSLVGEISDQLYPDNKTAHWIASYWGDTDKENNCGWGNITINPEGKAYTCNRIEDSVYLGDFLKDGLESIFKMGEAQRIATSVDNVAPCSKCAIRYICNGGCRIDDFDLLSQPPYRVCTDDNKKNKILRMIESSAIIYGMDVSHE